MAGYRISRHKRLLIISTLSLLFQFTRVTDNLFTAHQLTHTLKNRIHIPIWAALLPVVLLLTGVIGCLIIKGASFVAEYSYAMLLGAALSGLAVAFLFAPPGRERLKGGLRRAAAQTLPAVPILLLIGTVSATWMLSGVVPMLIELGLRYISAPMFLVITCCACAGIALLTGSSWSTIATIGVAFMGIGSLLGYSSGWVAGAIISGAYFGDKMSPLSDTTVLAASSSEVDLFTHIRYMLITTLPSLFISLTVFGVAGHLMHLTDAGSDSRMLDALKDTFHLTPWLYVIPALTVTLILLRVKTVITLAAASVAGLLGIIFFQPHILEMVAGDDSFYSAVLAAGRILLTDTSIATGHLPLDELVATGGMEGMLSTVLLILSAMMFGTVMLGTGMLEVITEAFTRIVRHRVGAVGATAASGLFLNSATADQYLSIIIGANMYRSIYQRLGLEGRLLSRTLEDSVSVTSVIIPWNSCGVTQSAVLGVATVTYLPYCVFNYLSPVMSILIALTGFKIRQKMKAPGAEGLAGAEQAPEEVTPEEVAVSHA